MIPASSRAICAAPWRSADWKGFKGRLKAAGKAGKIRGIGLA